MAESSRGVYAYMCAGCRHLLSTEHRLRQNSMGEWISHCVVCDCVTAPDASFLTLDQAGYERYLRLASAVEQGSCPCGADVDEVHAPDCIELRPRTDDHTDGASLTPVTGGSTETADRQLTDPAQAGEQS